MKNSVWQEAKRIFDEARRLPVAERATLVERSCAGNEELRTQVEILLGSYDSDFLEESVLGAAGALISPVFAHGQVIGKYRTQELIGSGGMGQVFRAEDTELNRPVAFKILHKDVAEDQERVRRFIQEARAASALNHPNILTIHEIGSFEGLRYIVSEYVEGETLRERMQRGLTAAESIDITSQIAAALEAAHSAGIVHRDIKPENVMFRKDGLVKVLDFGLAKLTEADDRPIDLNAPLSRIHTSPGLVMGTVAYMSPEQARGQAVDARSDLWSLGVVFHEMLTGKSPFEGETVTELMTSLLKTDGAPLHIDNVPSELRPICIKALSKDKESRYRSAHDLLDDLKGEKKKMEYAFQAMPNVSLPQRSDELKTQLIRRRPTLSAEYIVTGIKTHKYLTLLALVSIATLAIGMSVYRYNGATRPNPGKSLALIDASTTEKDLKFSRLPISRDTGEATLSPDGKYVAYETAKGIHLLELETQSDKVILAYPPGADAWWLTFSADSKYVYYVYDANSYPTVDNIMRVPVQGGTPNVIIADATDGAFGFSPDGSTMVFLRGTVRERTEWDELVLASPDGTNQRTFAKTAPGSHIRNRPIFSPDGKIVACQIWFTEGNTRYFKIVGFTLAGGEQRPISDKQWANLTGGVWLPNGNIIVSASEKSADTLETPQLWLVSPDGQAKAITNGLAGYQGLSATRDGSLIMSSEIRRATDLWLLPNNDSSRAQAVTTSGEISGGFTAAPDGRIVTGSRVTGNVDLWIMNQDGSGRKQLTHEGGRQPAVSPNNKYIVFHSERGDGKTRLYRMDMDGQNIRQLTNGPNNVHPRFSGDGRWVYYLNFVQGKQTTIAKVPIDGGESTVQVTPPDGWEFTMLDLNRSDGRIACALLKRDPNGPRVYKIGIVPADGRTVAQMIDLPSDLGSNVRWMPDGRSLATIGMHQAIEVWRVPITGKVRPSKLTDFRTPATYNYNWTVDGKSMLVSRATNTSVPVLIRNAAN